MSISFFLSFFSIDMVKKHVTGEKKVTAILEGFPGGSDGKKSACSVGDLVSIPALGRSPGAGPEHPVQRSCLENPGRQRSLERCSPWSHRVGHD